MTSLAHPHYPFWEVMKLWLSQIYLHNVICRNQLNHQSHPWNGPSVPALRQQTRADNTVAACCGLPGTDSQDKALSIKETRFDHRQTLSRVSDVGVVENISTQCLQVIPRDVSAAIPSANSLAWWPVFTWPTPWWCSKHSSAWEQTEWMEIMYW